MRSYDLSSYPSTTSSPLNLKKAKGRERKKNLVKAKGNGVFARIFKNKSSLFGLCLLGFVLLFCAVGAIASPYSYVELDSTTGSVYSRCAPKSPWFASTSFWNGRQEKSVNESDFSYYSLFDTERKPIVSSSKQGSLYVVDFDTYAVGSRLLDFSKDELLSYLDYENKTGRSLFLPLVDSSSYLAAYRVELSSSGFGYTPSAVDETITRMGNYYLQNPNVTYEVLPLLESDGSIKNNNVFLPRLDESGNVKRLYLPSISLDGHEICAKLLNGRYQVRVDYEVYFEAKFGFTPHYLFGSNGAGLDLFSRLCKGILFSLMLGVLVSAVNFVVGIAYGSVEGFYGGKVDLVLERVSEVAGALPSVILLSIFNILFNSIPGLPSSLRTVLGVFLAFIVTGWLGTASTARMQFYRFKNRDYVLASRSFGAKDRRLIFSHILPNAIGTIVTSSILMIPGVIYSESSLSYLGIIDFSGSGITSLGTLLNEGSGFLGTLYGYLLFFPSLFICLLMIGFNLFGNGLRDAFNPRNGGR